jgi:hypothetical protein
MSEEAQVEEFIQKFGGITEEYMFYEGQVTLRYDPADHVYLLVTPDGLEVQNGVTSICHIVDKSIVLIPWACKMMSQKINNKLEPYIHVDSTDITIPVEDIRKIVEESKTAHKEKLEEAGAIGHIAHNWIESYIKATLEKDEPLLAQITENMPVDERAKNACLAALDWMVKHNVRWLSTERKVYSRKHKFAGTMDGMCLTDSCNNPLCCKHKYKNHLTLIDWKTSNYLYVEFLFQTAAYEEAYEEETGEHVKDRWVVRLGKDDAQFEAWHLGPETYKDDWKAFLYCLKLRRAVDVVENRTKEFKDMVRGEKRAAKKKARAVAESVKCKASDRYKGTRKPTCNGGAGCEFCTKKYGQVQEEKSKKLQEIVDTKFSKKLAKLENKSAGVSPELIKSLNFLLDR